MRFAICLIAIALCAQPTYAAEKWSPTHSIPRINKVTIDAYAADWGDRGLRIDALVPADGQVVASFSDFDATVRLGWNVEEGVLLLAFVADDKLIAAGDGAKLVEGDAVEIVLAGYNGDPIRYLVAPPANADQTEARTWVDDRRRFPGEIKPTIRAAARKTRAGYMIEAAIPTRAITETTGGVWFGLDLRILDADRPGRLIPHVALSNWSATNDFLGVNVLLARQPSNSITTAVVTGHQDHRRGFATVVTASDALGRRVDVMPGPSLKERVASNQEIELPIAHEKVRRIGDRYAASVTFPLPPLAPPPLPPNPRADLLPYVPPPEPVPLNVYLDSVKVGEVSLPDMDAQRRHALAQIDLRFRSAIFAGKHFPAVDFADPVAARELLGSGYMLKPTFYNAAHEPVDFPDKPGRYGAVVEILPDNPAVQFPARLITLFKLQGETDWLADELKQNLALPPQFGVDPKVVAEQQPAIAELSRWILADQIPTDPDAPLLFAALAETKPGEPPLAGRHSIWAQDQRWWFPLKQTLTRANYKYLIDTPAAHDNGEKFPLLLYLHGSGERGDDLEQVRSNNPGNQIGKGGAIKGKDEFVIVSPQCPAGEWWSAQQLDLLLREVTEKYAIDADRIYVTGLSMGGYATWELAAEFPDRFAAIVPICGAGSTGDAGRLKHLPTWIFHGQKDAAVPVARSVEMFEALKKVGGRVKFTPYPDLGHDAWTKTYANPELYEWLLQQKRNAPQQPPAQADVP